MLLGDNVCSSAGVQFLAQLIFLIFDISSAEFFLNISLLHLSCLWCVFLLKSVSFIWRILHFRFDRVHLFQLWNVPLTVHQGSADTLECAAGGGCVVWTTGDSADFFCVTWMFSTTMLLRSLYIIIPIKWGGVYNTGIRLYWEQLYCPQRCQTAPAAGCFSSQQIHTLDLGTPGSPQNPHRTRCPTERR